MPEPLFCLPLSARLRGVLLAVVLLLTVALNMPMLAVAQENSAPGIKSNTDFDANQNDGGLDTGDAAAMSTPKAPSAPAQPGDAVYSAAPEKAADDDTSEQPEVLAVPGQPFPEVTLTEEQVGERGLLRNVLTASVSKSRELPITLETVLQRVSEQNLLIARDVLGKKISNNQFYRSLSDMLPDVSALQTQARFNGVIQIFGNEVIPIEQETINRQVDFTWRIEPGGRDVFISVAARRRYQSAKKLLEQTRQQQLAQAANTYYNLQAARFELDNIKLNLEESRWQVNYNQARLDAGVGTKLDVMRSRTLLAQQERRQLNAENAVGQAEQSLLELLNLDPNVALVPPPVVAQPRVLVPMTWTTDRMVAIAAANNPGLQATDADIKAIAAESWAVLSTIVPSVTLDGYRNRTGPQWDQLNTGKRYSYTIQTNLLENMGAQIPLDFRTKRLQRKQRVVEREAQLRAVQTQVIQAYLDSRAFAQSILTARDELEAAQEARRLAAGRFKAGLGIELDILNAQTSLNEARTGMVTAILGFNRSQVNLLSAMGEISQETLLKGLNVKTPPPTVAPPPAKPSSQPAP